MDPGVETKMYVRFCRSGLLSVTQEPWEKADYCGQRQQETLRAGSGAGRTVGCRAVVKLHGGLGGRWTGWAEECLLPTGSVILGRPLFCERCSLHLLGALRELGYSPLLQHLSFYLVVIFSSWVSCVHVHGLYPSPAMGTSDLNHIKTFLHQEKRFPPLPSDLYVDRVMSNGKCNLLILIYKALMASHSSWDK